MPAEIEKKCSMCGQTKPLSQFYHNSTKGDYHNAICKECQAKVNKKNKK